MIKLDTFDASKLGEDLQNLFLLSWREHILTMMNPIVWSISATE